MISPCPCVNANCTNPVMKQMMAKTKAGPLVQVGGTEGEREHSADERDAGPRTKRLVLFHTSGPHSAMAKARCTGLGAFV
jgi:hypothetical protein